MFPLQAVFKLEVFFYIYGCNRRPSHKANEANLHPSFPSLSLFFFPSLHASPPFVFIPFSSNPSRLLESPGFFSWKLQDLESHEKSLWSCKVLENILESHQHHFSSRSNGTQAAIVYHPVCVDYCLINYIADAFFAMDYTLNIVSKIVYYNI